MMMHSEVVLESVYTSGKIFFGKSQSCSNSCDIWLGRGPKRSQGSRRAAAGGGTCDESAAIHPALATKFGRWNDRVRPVLTESETRHRYLHTFALRFFELGLVR